MQESRGWREDPSAVVLDTQTIRSSLNAPTSTTGLDPGKRSRGRKRGIATDVLGLLITVIVVAANVHDSAVGTVLLDKVAADNPTVTKAWVDAGFKNIVAEHGKRLGIDVEVVQRDPGSKGFAVLPKRWVVEQTFGTLMLHRRLARDYETLPASSASMIYWAMTRRLTSTAVPTWRDPLTATARVRTSGGAHAKAAGQDRSPGGSSPSGSRTPA